MNDLFRETKQNVYVKNCPCLKKGVPVVMSRSLDPRFNVGTCPKCGNVITDEVNR